MTPPFISPKVILKQKISFSLLPYSNYSQEKLQMLLGWHNSKCLLAEILYMSNFSLLTFWFLFPLFYKQRSTVNLLALPLWKNPFSSRNDLYIGFWAIQNNLVTTHRVIGAMSSLHGLRFTAGCQNWSTFLKKTLRTCESTSIVCKEIILSFWSYFNCCSPIFNIKSCLLWLTPQLLLFNISSLFLSYSHHTK